MIKHVARFNGTDFCIITPFSNLSESINQVEYSNFQIDFTGFTNDLLPVRYQQIQIVRINENLTEELEGTYYCTRHSYPEISRGGNTVIKLNIQVGSPYTLSTIRTFTGAIDTVALNTAVETILQPLIDDGCTIEENTLKSSINISKVYKAKEVEAIMNELANENKFVWYIDKDKKIYLKDINLVNSQTPAQTFNDLSNCYMQSIRPQIQVVDYVNRLSLVDLRAIVEETSLVPTSTILQNGQYYAFRYPISVSENVAYRTPLVVGPQYLLSIITGTNPTGYNITVDKVGKTITYDANIGFSGTDDASGKKILLVRDAAEETKIVGFIWNAASETLSFGVSSISALVPRYYTVYDGNEIDTIADKLGTSGTVERRISMADFYLSNQEASDYSASLFGANNSQNNEATIKFKGFLSDNDFMSFISTMTLTSAIRLGLDFIEGKFIINNIKKSYDQAQLTYTVNCRSVNLNESYLDIYRPVYNQYTETDLENEFVIAYNQDEDANYKVETIVDGEVVNND